MSRRKPPSDALLQNPQGLEELRERIRLAGRDLPEPSLKCISWKSEWGCWRVLLPRFCGGHQVYFSPHNYGSRAAALIEAQYYRDNAYREAGVDLYARVRPTLKRRSRQASQPISETYCEHGKHFKVTGYWMETRNGVSKQRKVARVIGPRSREQAWMEVEAIVKAAIDAETQRVREQAVRSGSIPAA